MNVTKMELCNRVAKRIESAQGADLKPILETFLDEILEVLSSGERIEIRGFGVFVTKHRKKRLGRNPRTGDVVNIPSYMAPSFKFSKDAQKLFSKKLSRFKRNKRKEKTAEYGDDTPDTPVQKQAPAQKVEKKAQTRNSEGRPKANVSKAAEQFSI